MDTSCGVTSWKASIILTQKEVSCSQQVDNVILWFIIMCIFGLHLHFWHRAPETLELHAMRVVLIKRVLCYVNKVIRKAPKLGAGLVARGTNHVIRGWDIQSYPLPCRLLGERATGGWVLSPMANVMKPQEKPKGLGFRVFPGWWALRRAAHLEKARQLCSPSTCPTPVSSWAVPEWWPSLISPYSSKSRVSLSFVSCSSELIRPEGRGWWCDL